MTVAAEKNHDISFSMKTYRLRGATMLLITLVFAILMSLDVAPVAAQPSSIIGTKVQKTANGVLTLMGFSLTPDVTTGSLAFSNAETGTSGFSMTSLGGGFTISKDLPLYLEGTAGYSRYDPIFMVSDGREERLIPAKWNSMSGTAGCRLGFPHS